MKVSFGRPFDWATTPTRPPVLQAGLQASEVASKRSPSVGEPSCGEKRSIALLGAGGEVLDVVIQDEFTHDVVARLPSSAGALLVVFDST